jgi:hypothetical protein
LTHFTKQNSTYSIFKVEKKHFKLKVSKMYRHYFYAKIHVLTQKLSGNLSHFIQYSAPIYFANFVDFDTSFTCFFSKPPRISSFYNKMHFQNLKKTSRKKLHNIMKTRFLIVQRNLYKNPLLPNGKFCFIHHCFCDPS